MRFREHLISAYVSGLGLGGLGLGGLGSEGLGQSEIYGTDLIHSLNEWSLRTDQGTVKRFDVSSNFFVLMEKTFLCNRNREDTPSRMFRKIFSQFQQTKSQIKSYRFSFLY